MHSTFCRHGQSLLLNDLEKRKKADLAGVGARQEVCVVWQGGAAVAKSGSGNTALWELGGRNLGTKNKNKTCVFKATHGHQPVLSRPENPGPHPGLPVKGAQESSHQELPAPGTQKGCLSRSGKK